MLKMEAVHSSLTFLSTYKSTWYYNPQYKHRHVISMFFKTMKNIHTSILKRRISFLIWKW